MPRGAGFYMKHLVFSNGHKQSFDTSERIKSFISHKSNAFIKCFPFLFKILEWFSIIMKLRDKTCQGLDLKWFIFIIKKLYIILISFKTFQTFYWGYYKSNYIASRMFNIITSHRNTVYNKVLFIYNNLFVVGNCSSND